MGKTVNIDGVKKARSNGKAVDTAVSPEGEDAGALPPNCPVQPLGKDGRMFYYLSADRQLVELADRDHSRLGIQSLFGRRSELLFTFWPRMDKRGNVTGWAPDGAALALMASCSRAGLWDARERQRGRGAWLGEGGALVLHTGAHVMTFPATPTPYRDHVSELAGLVGRYVYGAADSQGVPAAEAEPSGPESSVSVLQELLQSWRWRRGNIDAVLMLGWIGAAMIGGALKWRPAIWLTGGKGTGKSTLHDVLKGVFAGGIVQTADTTAAGLYQTLKHQTLPIAVDELEAEADNRKSSAVIKLARLAASGSQMLRGGPDHRSAEFVVRSAFMFSSILVLPLNPQDRSRITLLNLNELEPGAPVPDVDPKKLAAIGAHLRRRLVDGWTRLEGILDRYRSMLQEAGHSARAADQLGTLLAVADILVSDAFEEDGARGWVKVLEKSELEEAEDQRDEDRCLGHLLSSPIDVYRGGARQTVGQWVRVAAEIDGDGSGVADAKQVLGTHGLKVLDPSPATIDGPAQPRRLAVANQHKGLAPLFEGSHWQGTPGTMGVWVQALRRLPGASTPTKSQYIGGSTCRCVTLPLCVVVPLDQVSPEKHDWLLKRG